MRDDYELAVLTPCFRQQLAERCARRRTDSETIAQIVARLPHQNALTIGRKSSPQKGNPIADAMRCANESSRKRIDCCTLFRVRHRCGEQCIDTCLIASDVAKLPVDFLSPGIQPKCVSYGFEIDRLINAIALQAKRNTSQQRFPVYGTLGLRSEARNENDIERTQFGCHWDQARQAAIVSLCRDSGRRIGRALLTHNGTSEQS